MAVESGHLNLQQSSVSVLSRRIFMTRILRQDLREAASSLLELIFYGDEEAVCSYTETPEEDDVSLFIDEKSLEAYFPEALSTSGQSYRAVRVYEGAEALNMCGYINLLSASLTRQGIEVVYLSTFNTDLLLVADEFLGQAHAHVSASLRSIAVLRPRSPAIPGISEGPASSGGSEQLLLAATAAAAAGERQGADLSLSRISSRLRLVSLAREALPQAAFHLLRVFLRNQESRFFSYTCVRGEITMVLEQEDLASLWALSLSAPPALGPLLTVHQTVWSSLQLNAGASGVGKNTVSHVSKVLAENLIDIFYLSTFNFDFIFTPTSKTDHAIKALLDSDSTIIYQD